MAGIDVILSLSLSCWTVVASSSWQPSLPLFNPALSPSHHICGVCTCARARMHVFARTRTRVRVQACGRPSARACVHARARARVCVCVCVCVCVDMRGCASPAPLSVCSLLNARTTTITSNGSSTGCLAIAATSDRGLARCDARRVQCSKYSIV
jgi:hypothetical protein